VSYSVVYFIFTARIYAYRGLCYLKMSVRLFVTRQYSVETAQYIIKLFSPSGSYTALVFVVPNVVAIFRQGPLTGASGYENIAIFSQYLAISRKRYKIRPCLLWNANRRPYRYLSCWIVQFLMTLSDLVKYLMTRSIARFLCDSWASCSFHWRIWQSIIMQILTSIGLY